MEHKLFSELIVKLPIKPDFFIAEKIDEIEIPFRNMKFVKKDINNLFLRIFNDFIKEYKEKTASYQNIEVMYDSSMSMFVEMGRMYELNIKKKKSECTVPLSKGSFDFDDSILTEEFIDEIDRTHILMSLVIGASFRKTIMQIENDYGSDALQSKLVYDQILEFWTKYSKNDFCYLSDLELNDQITIEDKELELCLLRFFFNVFKYAYIDLNKYEGERLEVIKHVINDKSNYRWYMIFGFWLIKRFEEKQVNTLELFFSEYKKLKEIMEEVLA